MKTSSRATRYLATRAAELASDPVARAALRPLAAFAPLFARLAQGGNRGTVRWLAALAVTGMSVEHARDLAAVAQPADLTPGRALRRLRRLAASSK